MKFLIIAPARSGSTLLREMLDRHPEVCCSGELYGALRVRALSVHIENQVDLELAFRMRRSDPIGFVEQHVFASRRPAVGFKLLYSQMFVFDFVPAMHWMMQDPDLRVIHLWRRDLIARHVSETRLRLKVRASSAQPAPANFLERSLQPAVVQRSCELQLAARGCARQLFAGKPMLELDYEDFIQDHARQSARLCEFLAVRPGRWPPLAARGEGPADAEVLALRSVPALQRYADHS